MSALKMFVIASRWTARRAGVSFSVGERADRNGPSRAQRVERGEGGERHAEELVVRDGRGPPSHDGCGKRLPNSAMALVLPQEGAPCLASPAAQPVLPRYGIRRVLPGGPAAEQLEPAEVVEHGRFAFAKRLHSFLGQRAVAVGQIGDRPERAVRELELKDHVVLLVARSIGKGARLQLRGKRADKKREEN